jgi:hypothetical protein
MENKDKDSSSEAHLVSSKSCFFTYSNFSRDLDHSSSRLYSTDSIEVRSDLSSVADPGCLSRIPDPDFYPSRIPDPKTATKERGEKKFDVIPFYVAKNFTKLYIILVLKC